MTVLYMSVLDGMPCDVSWGPQMEFRGRWGMGDEANVSRDEETEKREVVARHVEAIVKT